MNDEKKGMLAAAAAYTIFGFSYLFSKLALGVTEPLILLVVRFSITFAGLNLLVLFRFTKLNLKGKNLIAPVFIGILQPVLYFVLENYGIKYTTTSFAGLLSASSPVFSAITGVIFLKERPRVYQWIGIMLSVMGVLSVSLAGTGGHNTIGGCICLLLAYLSGAFYCLLIRKYSKQFTPFELTYVMFTVGFVFFSALAFITYRSDTVQMITSAVCDKNFIIAVLYLGIASSIIAYLLSNYSLSRLPLARSTIFTSFSTVVSVMSGVVIMHDEFTWLSVAAFILIITGITMVNYQKSKK